MDTIRILYIAEIVGSSGVFTVKSTLPQLREELGPDLVMANVDGATGGFGIGRNHAVYLHKLGIDVMTSGECIFYKKDMVGHLEAAPYVLRAANYPEGVPGRGWLTVEAKGHEVGVVSLLGISGFTKTHLSNPFNLLPCIVAEIKKKTPVVIVDFHAATTAEKLSLFHHMDSEVSAIIGSHGKVRTADGGVSDLGTASITDAGRTGASAPVGGLDPEIEIRKHLTQIYERSKAGWQDLQLQGVVVDVTADGAARVLSPVVKDCPREGMEKQDD